MFTVKVIDRDTSEVIEVVECKTLKEAEDLKMMMDRGMDIKEFYTVIDH